MCGPFAVLACLILSAKALVQFDSLITDADFPFEQIAFDNSANTIGNTNANSGNIFDVGTITNLNPAGPDFGVGLGQFSSNNIANSDLGDADSGNFANADQILNSSFIVEQFSEFNFAQSDEGDANAGNIFEIPGGSIDSYLDISQVALYNTAISDTGDANAGNILDISDIIGGSINLSQVSIGNTATSNSGEANSGNVIDIGNLGGRRLQKYVTEFN